MNLDLGDTRLIIEECKKQGLLRNQAAYVLATAYHESAHTMKPVREYGGEAYLKKKKYYPYVGMGHVQLTWDYNYKKATSFLGVDFMENPKLLLEAKYSVPILVVGMKDGWFTGKKLSNYVTLKTSNFFEARAIVNGDKNYKSSTKKPNGSYYLIGELIEKYAKEYDAQLKELGYGEGKPIETKPFNFIEWLISLFKKG